MTDVQFFILIAVILAVAFRGHIAAVLAFTIAVAFVAGLYLVIGVLALAVWADDWFREWRGR